MMTIDNSTPFEYVVSHVAIVGWPSVCLLFFWIGRTLQKGIQEYAQDRAIIRETKETVDIKTDAALKVMNETKSIVDTMMNNHLHTIENKVDGMQSTSDKLVDLLGDIKQNTAVMAALLKDRKA